MCIALPPPDESRFSLLQIEAGLTLIAIAAAFAWPGLGSKWFSSVEHAFRRLARREGVSVGVVGLLALVLRLAILPIHAIPVPSTPDDFSNLLAADTFAHGRLTNPTPAMWVHFESIHVDMKPTYMSMYFPAEGLALAAGKVLFGQPWFGVLITGSLMCAALCWMLQGWLPPSWALLGGLIAILRLSLFSYWENTYHTGGTIAALGGALVLGAFPRFVKRPCAPHGLLMASGVVLLGITRPYEGVLLCLPITVGLIHWLWTAKNRPRGASGIRILAPGLILLIAGVVWMGYYDSRVFGSALKLPYTVNRATYALAPYFVWQQPHPEPAYRHEEMRRFYRVNELYDYYRVHSRSGYPKITLIKAVRGVVFFTGMALIPPLFMLPWAVRDRHIRFLVLCLVVLAFGMAIQIYLFPHYLAPFTAALYAVGLQAMRHLWQWRPGHQNVGMTMTRFLVSICVLMTVVRLFDKQLHCPVPARPVSTWVCNWFGPDHFDRERETVQRRLEQLSGSHLAIVRYSPDHDPIDEWVYNAADIEGSKVIWARAMDEAQDKELIRYYANRKIWLVQPDSPQHEIEPYPVSKSETKSNP